VTSRNIAGLSEGMQNLMESLPRLLCGCRKSESCRHLLQPMYCAAEAGKEATKKPIAKNLHDTPVR